MIARIALVLIAAGLAAWIALVIFVTVKEKTAPQADPTNTQAIIVLGAQVQQDGSLSVQLQWRLDKALEMYVIKAQPIVVCGAQGTNEPTTEAAAMYAYLRANGVPEEHLILEDSSFNTRQNLANARQLLDEDVQRVLIVTSDYHLPRALALASDTGFDACGVGSPIKAVYWIKNHFREALAWVKYALQKWGILKY